MSHHPLVVLWQSFWRICRFQTMPQQLPHSRPLLAVILGAYLLLQFGFTAMDPEVTVVKALAATLADSGLQIVLTVSLLYMVHYAGRIVQTLIALFGTGIIINVISAPLLYWLFSTEPKSPDQIPPALLILMLGIWNLLIVAHILRHALSSTFGTGLLVAFVFGMMNLVLSVHLFAPPQ